MRLLVLVAALFGATPALAHHEAVVVTAIMPLAVSLALLAVGVGGAVMRRFRKK